MPGMRVEGPESVHGARVPVLWKVETPTDTKESESMTVLSAEAWDELQHILDNPGPPNPALMKLADDYRRDRLAGRIVSPPTADELKALLKRVASVLEDVDHVLGHGGFKNGVTDSSNTMDEGEVRAGKVFGEVHDLLVTIKRMKL